MGFFKTMAAPIPLGEHDAIGRKGPVKGAAAMRQDDVI